MNVTSGFRRVLLSYLPVFFVISLTLLLLAYLALGEMSQRSAARANMLLSHSISQTIDDVLRGLDEWMMTELRGNEALKAFFAPASSAERQQKDYEAAAALSDMLRKQPMLHSVYVYRTLDQRVLTPSSLTPLDQFGDKQFIGANISTLHPLRWETKRLYREQPDAAAVPVVSLVKIASFSDRGLIVIHVSTERLSEMVSKMSQSKLHFVELVDAEGGVIASKLDGDESAASSGSGTESKTPDAGKELSLVRSDYTGWSVRSGIYNAGILEWVSSLFYLWMSIGFAVIVLGAVWLFYVTRRNYRPIELAASRIKAYARQKSEQLRIEEKKDEFKYIEAAIGQLLDQHSLMQVQVEENVVYRRRHVFLQLLEDAHYAGRAERRHASELSLLGLDPPVGGALAALVEIDQFHDFAARYDRRDQHLLKQVLSNVAKEIADGMQTRISLEWVNPHQLGLLFHQDATGDPDELERSAVNTLDHLRQWTEQNLTFTVTAGLGGYSESLGGLPRSYRDAQQMLGYKSSLGTNRLIMPADIDQPHDQMFRRLQDIRLICQAFRSGDPVWSERLDDLFRSVREALFTRDDLYQLFNMLTVHLHREMMELSAEFQEIWHNGFGRKLETITQRYETLDDMHAELEQVMREAFADMQAIREARSAHQTLQHVLTYIEEHFNDPDLSQAQVSAAFGYNASYFSRIFRDTFGVKFIDYITKVRMDKALELLRETDSPVQEIAEQVGYANALSFIRAFKKHTGTTPGNYRKDSPDAL